jgi:hypothetical protein
VLKLIGDHFWAENEWKIRANGSFFHEGVLLEWASGVVVVGVSLSGWYQHEAQGPCFLTRYEAPCNSKKIKTNFGKEV